MQRIQSKELSAVYNVPLKFTQLLQVLWQGQCYEFSISHAGTCSRKREDRPSAEHAHDVYHIVLCSQGGGTIRLNGHDQHSHPGMLVLASPGEPHCFTAAATYIELCFFLASNRETLRIPFHELLSLYTGDALRPSTFPITLGKNQMKGLSELLETITEQLMYGSETTKTSIALSIVNLFAFLVREIYGVVDGFVDAQLLVAKSEIEKRYREDITLEYIAQFANLSPGHLGRLFKATFGVTPIAYHREYRINIAKKLLLITEFSCKEIAERVGYTDFRLFCRTFKKLARITPTEFRRNSGRRGLITRRVG